MFYINVFSKSSGGPGSNLADLAIIYRDHLFFFLFSDFEEQLENVYLSRKVEA